METATRTEVTETVTQPAGTETNESWQALSQKLTAFLETEPSRFQSQMEAFQAGQNQQAETYRLALSEMKELFQPVTAEMQETRNLLRELLTRLPQAPPQTNPPEPAPPEVEVVEPPASQAPPPQSEMPVHPLRQRRRRI